MRLWTWGPEEPRASLPGAGTGFSARPLTTPGHWHGSVEGMWRYETSLPSKQPCFSVSPAPSPFVYFGPYMHTYAVPISAT